MAVKSIAEMPGVVLSRFGPLGRAAANRMAMAATLGVGGTRLHRDDWRRAAAWGPRARRVVYNRIWSDAAAAVGASFEPVTGDFSRIRGGGRTTIVWFHEVQLGDPVTARLALDKVALGRLLEDAGLPRTRSLEFAATAPSEAAAFMRTTAGPHVVKPARGTSSGEGVTCSIGTLDELRRAIRWAHRWGERLLIEQQVQGDEYRFLFLDSELIGVVRRRPTHVTGDGALTITELISKENRRRADSDGWAGLTFLKVDLDMVLTLEHHGLHLSSVPPRCDTVRVKSTANTNGATDNETVPLATLSPSLVEDAAAAAAAAGLRLAGVDLITPRTDCSLAEAGGSVLEVNATPGFHYHYLVADPTTAVPVAIPVLKALLRD